MSAESILHPVLLFMSDTHTGESSQTARVRKGLDWGQQEAGSDLVGFMHGGDGANAPYISESMRFYNWVRDPDGGNLAPEIPLIPAPGNHDADLPMTAPYGETTEDPFSCLREALSWDSENGIWDYGQMIRVVRVQNISEHVQISGHPAYHNINYPGADGENADHSGMTDPDSPQRVWMDEMFNSDHPWKIGLGHRSPYCPINYDLRPQHLDFRPALLVPTLRGMSLFCSGDCHVGSFGGPVMPPDQIGQAGLGMYWLTNAGGYAIRPVDPSVVPDCLLWSDGNPGTNPKCVHASLIRFSDDHADLVQWRAANDCPDGEVVYQGTIARNYGAQ